MTEFDQCKAFLWKIEGTSRIHLNTIFVGGEVLSRFMSPYRFSFYHPLYTSAPLFSANDQKQIVDIFCHLCLKYSSAGLVIERLRVRIPAGAAGELSSSESNLCADSYSVSV